MTEIITYQSCDSFICTFANLCLFQAHADCQRLVYPSHGVAVQRPDVFLQPFFVNSPYLLQKGEGIAPKPLLRFYWAMSWHIRLVRRPACYDCGDDGLAVFVAGIVLYD